MKRILPLVAALCCFASFGALGAPFSFSDVAFLRGAGAAAPVTFTEEWDDSAWHATGGGLNPAGSSLWSFTSVNTDWNALGHATGGSGEHSFFGFVGTTNQLANHGARFLGISEGDGGASLWAALTSSASGGAFAPVASGGGVQVSAYLRTWPTIFNARTILVAKGDAAGAANHDVYGVGIGDMRKNANGTVTDLGTWKLLVSLPNTADVEVRTITTSAWLHVRITVTPTGTGDHVVVETESGAEDSGTWTTEWTGDVAFADAAYLADGAGRYVGFTRLAAGGNSGDPTGLDDFVATTPAP